MNSLIKDICRSLHVVFYFQLHASQSTSDLAPLKSMVSFVVDNLRPTLPTRIFISRKPTSKEQFSLDGHDLPVRKVSIERVSYAVVNLLCAASTEHYVGL